VDVLSEIKIATYRTDGVMMSAFRLPPDELDQLRSLTDRLIAANPHMVDDHHDLPIADRRGSVHHTRPLIRIRGRDVSGLNDFTIGHPPTMGAVQRPQPA